MHEAKTQADVLIFSSFLFYGIAQPGALVLRQLSGAVSLRQDSLLS